MVHHKIGEPIYTHFIFNSKSARGVRGEDGLGGLPVPHHRGSPATVLQVRVVRLATVESAQTVWHSGLSAGCLALLADGLA